MKLRTKNLIKDSLILSVGDMGSKLLIFALIPFFTYYLSSSEYGTLDLVQVTITLLIPIATLSIYESMLRFILDGVNTKVVLSTSLIIVLSGVSLVGVFLIFLMFFLPLSLRYVLIYLVFLLNSIHIIQLYYCRSIKEMKIYAYNSLIYTGFLFGGTVTSISVFDLGLDGFFIANIIAYIISILHFSKIVSLKGVLSFKSFDWKMAKNMISYSLPLMPNSLMWWVINASSRYLILFFLGSSANGLFAVSSRVSGMITVFNSIFFKAWQLSSIEYKNDSETLQYNLIVFRNFNSFIFLIVGACIVLVKPTFMLLGPEYYSAWKYTPLLLIAVAFSSISSFLGTNYIVNMQTKGIFYTSLISAVVTLTLNVVLIPYWGLYGVGVASISGFFVMTVLRWRENKLYAQNKALIRQFTINIVVLSLICLTVFYNLDSNVLLVIKMMLILVLALVNIDFLKLVLNLSISYIRKRKVKS